MLSIRQGWFLWTDRAFGNLKISVSVRDVGVLFNSLAMTSEEILGGQQTLYTDGPSRMEAAGGNAYFSSKAVAESVTKSGGCVHIHAGAVDLS